MSAEIQPRIKVIQSNTSFNLKRFFLQWEWLLAVLLVVIHSVNSMLSPHYLDYQNMMSAISIFLDKAILVFPMMLVILLGDIDVSVASTIAVSGVSMGWAYTVGLPMPAAIGFGLIVGLVCGTVNGLLIIKFKELSAVIVTIGTMICYRGLASIVLEDRAVGGFPLWVQFFGWGKIGTFPFILLFVALEAVIFGYVVHFTTFGRRLYAMGNNPVTSRFSGIATDWMKLAIFALNGLFAGITALFLISKMGSVRPNIAQGYELDIIAMVVLGGVSTSGGKGNVPGVVLAIFIIGLLRYGLGLINVPSQTIMIIVGALLVIAVAIPHFKQSVHEMLSAGLHRSLTRKHFQQIKEKDVK